jgi:hypothetical protein
LIATLAVETGIAPSALLDEDDTMVRAMLDVIEWRSKQATKGMKKRGL